MSIVTLASGGLDSSLMALMIKDEGIKQYPLFINYGQLCVEKEWDACVNFFEMHNMPEPHKMNIAGFGETIQTGLTCNDMDVFLDAFLPGRNLLFLLIGCSYAYKKNANSVAIGLLNESTHIFPDQTKEFLKRSEEFLSKFIDKKTKIIAPLIDFYKTDVLEMANKYSISNTYSCHAGQEKPCGNCISCKEMNNALERME